MLVFVTGLTASEAQREMIDPQPLSREVAHHDARSAFFRLKADTDVAHAFFTGIDSRCGPTSGAANRCGPTLNDTTNVCTR